MSEQKRRKWTASEKLRIVLTCMQPGVEVAGGVSSGGDQPDDVLHLEEEALGLGGADLRREAEEAGRRAGAGGSGDVPDEGRDRRDHGGEPGAKKNAFGLEDHGKMPPELQQRVHEEVKLTKKRSGWPVGKTLSALGVTRTTYYRWLREEAWAKARPAEPPKPVQPYEALPEEKAAVREYALSASGASAPGVDLADGGRGRGVLGSEHSVPDIAGSEAGLSLEKEEQASPGGGREGDEAEPDLGDGHQVRVGRRAGLLPGLLPGRVQPLHRASRAFVGHGWGRR